MTPTVIAILTRSPADPRLKARIAPVVPDTDQRRDLVLAFIDDLMARAGEVPDTTWKIAVTPPLEGLRLARPWIPFHQILLQRGATFGDRLRHVVQDLAHAGFRHIVLLGADVPDLPPRILADAVRATHADAGAIVTGPSGDGSFYLLGMTIERNTIPDLFSATRWGTPHMLDDVEAAAIAHARRVVRVDSWHDVDTPQDVQELADRLRLAPATAPRTAEALSTIGVIGK